MYGLPTPGLSPAPPAALSQSSCLDQINEVAKKLSHATNLDQLKRLRDRAEYLRTLTVKRELGIEVHNDAAEIKLRAERKLGGRLSEMKLRGGDRRSHRKGQVSLRELGIDKNQSARWQQEASVPDELFTDYLARTRTHGQEISSAALLRLAKKIRQGCGTNRVRMPEPLESTKASWTRERWSIQAAPLEASEIATEGKNHLKTLNTLFEFLCDQANLPPDAGESRACRRYLFEVAIQFDELLDAFIRMTRAAESKSAIESSSS